MPGGGLNCRAAGDGLAGREPSIRRGVIFADLYRQRLQRDCRMASTPPWSTPSAKSRWVPPDRPLLRSAAPPPAAPPPPVLPGSLGAFDRPSERAGEPVTAGMPTGPGPGPEVLFHADPTEETLRALYRIDPGNEHIRELLEDYDTGAA
jgi:hypothetical protein